MLLPIFGLGVIALQQYVQHHQPQHTQQAQMPQTMHHNAQHAQHSQSQPQQHQQPQQVARQQPLTPQNVPPIQQQGAPRVRPATSPAPAFSATGISGPYQATTPQGPPLPASAAMWGRGPMGSYPVARQR